MDALSRPLLESELKVLSTLKELDDAAQPAGLDHIRQALHPLPCHQTVAYLLQQGVIGHPPSLSGTPNETLYVLTPQGERVLADYQANKRKPTPDPKLHEAPPKDTPGDEAAIESALQALGREEEKAEMDQLAGRAFAGLKFPGRFHLIPINAKGAWIESKATDITAGDSERLIYAVTEAFGQGVELVGGRIVADGKEVGVVVRKGDPQPETKPRGRKPAKAK